MIVTVTMNPAIDKTIEVENLELGGLNRIKHVEIDVGGKGINVSKTIQKLGEISVATGFIAGNSGKIIENFMNNLGIKTDFITVEGETRTNTKVFEESGKVTELNEPGAKVSEEQIEALETKILGYVDENTIVVLAGSVPAGVDKGIYAKITESVHKKGGKVLMDADGELFVKALEAGPDMIKPNRDELQKYVGIDHKASENELLSSAKKLMEKGISNIAVSMGSSGAVFIGEGYCVRCPGIKVAALSTVGAGDAMVAAIAYSWDMKFSIKDMISYCVATSAGAVTTIGTKPPAKELVEELRKKVIIEYIE